MELLRHALNTKRTFIYIACLVLMGKLVVYLGCNSDKRTSENSQVRVDKSENTIRPNFSEYYIRDLEIRIHELINEERIKKGLPLLTIDSKLSDIARRHSQDMLRRNFFDHVNPDGQDATSRGKSAGYPSHKDHGIYYSIGLGEDIFMTYMYDSIIYNNAVTSYDFKSLEEIAQSIVKGWMESKGHRENILNPSYDHEGIGVAISKEYKVLITQDLW